MIERRNSRDPASVRPFLEVLMAIAMIAALGVMSSHQAHQTPGVERVEVCR